MIDSLRKGYELIVIERPMRWAALLVLALLVSGLEMFGAIVVYALLALVADPSSGIDLPFVGDVRRFAGGVDDQTFLLGVVALMALFFVVRSSVRIFQKYVQARMAYNAGARLSSRMLDGYLRWPYERHLTRTTADLIRNGHQATNSLVQNVVLPGLRITAEATLVLGLVIVLTLIAPLATGAAVVIIGGAAVLLLIYVQPRLRRLGTLKHLDAKATLSTFQQALFGIRDIKVLAREQFFVDQYRRRRNRMARADYLVETASQLPSIILEAALLGFILAFFALSIIVGGDATEALSTLGLFAYAGLRVQPSLQTIVSGLNKIKFTTAPLDDLYADLQSMDHAASGEPVKPLGLQDRLVVEDVTFSYENADRPALSGVTFDIARGEQIGICGPTGGGKTTLVDVITGLLTPTHGRVVVDGADVRDKERSWQATIGIVPQMVFLTDDTLRRNVALGVPDGRIDEDAVLEAIRLAQLEDFVADLPMGLETEVGERGVRVSGGQRQRLAIARALYRRPDVLIFDEGTSALDNTTEKAMMASIDRLRGRLTVIMVAHRLGTVKDADKVLFLEAGQLAGLGTYRELEIANATFRAMAAAG